MVNDLVSDMINRIKVFYSVKREYVFILFSNFVYNILLILKDEGYILNFYLIGDNKKQIILLFLKYFNNRPVIQIFNKVSKLSLRVYCSYKNIPRVMNGLGISIISTNCGLMSDNKARFKGLGGEIICNVF